VARTQIAELSASSTRQQQSISQLTQEKALLNEEIESYNQQLLTLKGDYETVKSKYEELIKPARSAKGKYIAEVYYVKGQSGEIIRYRQPGDAGYSRLSLAEVEKRLDKLKQEQGENLYVKIIIPKDSGLSYSEAWGFMRNLLVKYDYYYQE
jgi:chromosome segregation ATPase